MKELLGTMILTALGGFSICNKFAHIDITLIFAFVVGILVYAYGAQMNPALSLTLFVAGKIDAVQFIKNTGMQFSGAFLGAVCILIANKF